MRLLGGMSATSSSSAAMPTWIIRASAWPSSGGCWKRRGFASASSRSRTGRAPRRSRRWASRACSFGVTAGNMDSMVNRYTSDKRVRSDDAYTPGGAAGKRPDRSVIVYSQRLARRPIATVPIVIGGIEASLRRIAHFDYWSEKCGARCCSMPRRPARLRQCRAADHRHREAPRCRRDHRPAARPARHGLRARRPCAGLHRDRFTPSGCTRPVESAGGSLRHEEEMRDKGAPPPSGSRAWCASCVA